MTTKIGAWLIGAGGALASTVVVGARAITHGLAGPTGLVTELPELRALSLLGLDQLVFGGWEINSRGVLHQARALASDHRALSPGLVAAMEDDLLAVERRSGWARGRELELVVGLEASIETVDSNDPYYEATTRAVTASIRLAR